MGIRSSPAPSSMGRTAGDDSTTANEGIAPGATMPVDSTALPANELMQISNAEGSTTSPTEAMDLNPPALAANTETEDPAYQALKAENDRFEQEQLKPLLRLFKKQHRELTAAFTLRLKINADPSAMSTLARERGLPSEFIDCRLGLERALTREVTTATDGSFFMPAYNGLVAYCVREGIETPTDRARRLVDGKSLFQCVQAVLKCGVEMGIEGEESGDGDGGEEAVGVGE
ncbi:hypothetical protein Q7P37_006859 [Cladosporium fusiforme]